VSTDKLLQDILQGLKKPIAALAFEVDSGNIAAAQYEGDQQPPIQLTGELGDSLTCQPLLTLEALYRRCQKQTEVGSESINEVVLLRSDTLALALRGRKNPRYGFAAVRQPDDNLPTTVNRHRMLLLKHQAALESDLP
jgi:hypothetical protein